MTESGALGGEQDPALGQALAKRSQAIYNNAVGDRKAKATYSAASERGKRLSESLQNRSRQETLALKRSTYAQEAYNDKLQSYLDRERTRNEIIRSLFSGAFQIAGMGLAAGNLGGGGSATGSAGAGGAGVGSAGGRLGGPSTMTNAIP
jgi:hypothetical protein